jgi:hypothetical protein
MSTSTQVPAGAALQRYARSETVEVDGIPARLHVALWEGNYSKGYQSDYERVPTRWLVVEVRDLRGARLRYPSEVHHGHTYRGELRRRCQSFSGKRYEKALAAFETIIVKDKLTEPGAAEAHAYYHLCHNGPTAHPAPYQPAMA